MAIVRLGIDFGTTTTAIALRVGDELAEVLPIGNNGESFMPSIVYIPPGAAGGSAQVLVGEAAESSAVSGYVVHSVKRCLGCPGGDRCRESRANGCRWCEGDGRIHVKGVEPVLPEHIAYRIIHEALSRAIRVARDQYDVDLANQPLTIYPTNLGCGAAFDLTQRRLILAAAHHAGLTHVAWENVIEEPILAGFAFSRFIPGTTGRVLIYDFGGGSFDAAILDIRREQATQHITVLATAGENWLGGDDIDGLVRQYFVGQIAQQLDLTEAEVEEKLEPVDSWRLRLFSKRAKEQLTDDTEFENTLITDNLGLLILNLTRARPEELVSSTTVSRGNLLDRSLKAVQRACRLAFAMKIARESDLLDARKVTKHTLANAAADIDHVLLVGGVTKMPMVRERLIEVFGISKVLPETVFEPVTAVAIGAAYPRDPQHFSVAFPPYEFALFRRKSMKSKVDVVPIFLPYEHYRFHEDWASNAVPVHRAQAIDVTVDFDYAAVGYRRIGIQTWSWHEIGRLQAGRWEFVSELDGMISVIHDRGKPRTLFVHPGAHPTQLAIRTARDERAKDAERTATERVLKNITKGYFEA
jgi:molecular chaperone DnaK